MKITISISAELHKTAETLAQQLGLSQGELYTAAITQFIKTHQKQSRALWEGAFAQMAVNGDDTLLVDELLSLESDQNEWVWE